MIIEDTTKSSSILNECRFENIQKHQEKFNIIRGHQSNEIIFKNKGLELLPGPWAFQHTDKCMIAIL